MSINKSQGHTLSNIELFLPRHLFSHDQYIVVSRVTTRQGLKILMLMTVVNVRRRRSMLSLLVTIFWDMLLQM